MGSFPNRGNWHFFISKGVIHKWHQPQSERNFPLLPHIFTQVMPRKSSQFSFSTSLWEPRHLWMIQKQDRSLLEIQLFLLRNARNFCLISAPRLVWICVNCLFEHKNIPLYFVSWILFSLQMVKFCLQKYFTAS